MARVRTPDLEHQKRMLYPLHYPPPGSYLSTLKDSWLNQLEIFTKYAKYFAGNVRINAGTKKTIKGGCLGSCLGSKRALNPYFLTVPFKGHTVTLCKMGKVDGGLIWVEFSLVMSQ